MPALEPPTLHDRDLTLRPGRLEDAEAVTAACQDPEIQRWTRVPSPYRREHAEEWLATPPAGDNISLLAFAGGRLAGSFGLIEIDVERGYGEIGYWVAPEARRRGVATRAVRLLDGWARAQLGLRTIEILVQRRTRRRAAWPSAAASPRRANCVRRRRGCSRVRRDTSSM